MEQHTDADHADAAQSLGRADALTSRANRSTRWYAFYLVVFGVMSFVIAVAFSYVHSAAGALTLSGLWVAFVLVLTWWQTRQQTVMLGTNRLHLWVMGLWACAWLLTLFGGLYAFPDHRAWWVGGGVLMALPPLVGAYLAIRRTKA